MGRQEQRGEDNSPPVEIYGPEGLRMWLRVAIRYSVSRICPPYRVHEIMNVPMAPEWDFSQRTRRFYYKGNNARGGGRRRQVQPPGQRQTLTSSSSSSSWANPRGLAGEDPINWISQANNMQLEASALYGEIEGGRQIHPIYNHPLSSDGAPVWEVEDEEDVKVYAAPMSHGIPCLGYVVEELPRPGRLRNDIVEPVVQRNALALQAAGFPIPMKAMAVIKNLPLGSAFTFPDGTVVTQQEAVEPPRRGRKVVICGDTCDSRALDKLAQDATVVIHEATNAFLPGVDKNKDTTVQDVTRDAITHGHSTPQIAGQFARRVHAKLLVLNHFSARYKGDISVDSLSIMMRIEAQAMKASALNETQVVAAWDLMVLPIPQL
jgi:ribonuclease BN (tRNA processing enzyme)